MTTLVYDGSFEGLLTAVYEIYDRKLTQVSIQRGEHRNQALFEDVIDIPTITDRANRVLKGLKTKLTTIGVQRLYAAHLAEMEGSDNTLIGYMRYVFDSPKNIEEDYGNRYVMQVSEMVRKIRREKHRMEAFIRFQKLKDGTFYASIEPDFNVLPLLIRHFKNRYADQRWIIYDMQRKYGLYYDLHDVQYITFDFTAPLEGNNLSSACTEDEGLYQSLWKSYFKSANIPARKNTKLHLMHVPRRYWKHLTEKI